MEPLIVIAIICWIPWKTICIGTRSYYYEPLLDLNIIFDFYEILVLFLNRYKIKHVHRSLKHICVIKISLKHLCHQNLTYLFNKLS